MDSRWMNSGHTDQALGKEIQESINETNGLDARYRVHAVQVGVT